MYGGVNYKGYTLDQALKSVGAGWSSLIHEVFTKLEQVGNPVKIIQVKEKFGGLRVYTDYVNDELDTFILDVERRSLRICEECGVPGKIRGGGWYKTFCDEHAEGRPAIKDEDY